MKNRIRWGSLCAALAVLLAGCSTEQEMLPEEPVLLTVSTGDCLDTLDPMQAGVRGAETVLYHVYENLMRWEDGGNGWAVVTEGQADSYTAETDHMGHTTYTFTLRQDAAWSDGKAVTGEDFAAAWRRLADPANPSPHRELLAVVAGYEEVQETGDTSRLAVSAPDAQTFTVQLNSSCAYFLEELCASAYTMPVRTDTDMDGTVSNGAYTVAEQTQAYVRLERSATYYGMSGQGPEEITFVAAGTPEEDYQRLLRGELDLLSGLPGSALQETEEDWVPEPVTAFYGVLFNTTAPPFDQLNVRQAFRLAVDTQAAADALENPAIRPAAGLIPYGVTDYGESPEAEDSTALSYWDFRTHSLDKVTVPTAGSYEENCRQAKRLMVQAGYPNGEGFPLVEYLYIKSEENDRIASTLRQMWQSQLGVAILLRGVTEAEYTALVYPEPETTETAEGTSETEPAETEDSEAVYTIAAQRFAAPYNTAAALLGLWHSGSGNPTGYQSDALDILLETAASAAEPDVQDALLHDAEAILMTESPVFAVCYEGSSFQLAEKWSGLYRRPNGIYFLFNITKVQQ